MTPPIRPGFADPVIAAQQHFRSLLQAMSEPGRIVPLEGELPRPPHGLLPSTFAMALSLVDFETPLWLDLPLEIPETSATLRFHCGMRLVRSPGEAAFAILAGPDAVLPIDRFASGTPEYPDRSATLLVQVDGFDRGSTALLRGPGIASTIRLSVCGTTAGFWRALADNHALFPQGVDTVLLAPERIVALPRSTSVEIA
jgi:alpha-D-ribose 1-methylphosphonate 5-triphosphate synthase subunit PhnH